MLPNAIFFHRIGRWCYKNGIPVVPKIIQGIIFLLYNSKITAETEIGKKSFFVCKGISTVLIPGTIIGSNTIIGLRFSTVRKFPYKKVPVIGNNVWLGPNSVVAGPVFIEDNSIIAANSFVNKSVPSGAIVAGNPAKIIGWVKDLDYNVMENRMDKEDIAPFLE